MSHDDQKVEVNFSAIVENLNTIDSDEFNFWRTSPCPTQQIEFPSSAQTCNSLSSVGVPVPIDVTPVNHTFVSNVGKELRKKIERERTDSEFLEIFNSPSGLYGVNKYNEKRIVFPFELESCYYIKPNSLYVQEPYYCIKFKGITSPLNISEKDFTKSGKIVQAIMNHCGESFIFYKNKSKIQTATHMLLKKVAMNATLSVPFYYGWKKESNYWEYSLNYGKTHGNRNHPISEQDFAPPEPIQPALKPDASVKLSAAVQVSEMMNIFTTPATRNIIWDLLHIASLYSLLEGLGYRFPLGVCLYSKDALVQNILKCLFEWFDDEIIFLSDDASSIFNKVLERKDQPLLIRDDAAQVPSSKRIEQATQTGSLFKKEKSYALQALPVVLSSTDTHLSLSASFIRLDLPFYSLENHAYQTIENQLPYFKNYLAHFNYFAQENIDTLKALLKNNTSRVFELSITSLSSECITAQAIFHAVDQFARDYMKSLHVIPKNPLYQ